MDVFLTLTTVGVDQGNLFDLYSNVDGFNSPFETDVAIASLLAGYTTILAPDGTVIVRICGQGVLCVNCVDIKPIYTTTTSTTLPDVGCEETTNSGGAGVTEYVIQLEQAGADLVFDFQAYGVPDKLEIIHSNIKKATSGMTVVNAGPFDDIYGDPLVPTPVQTIPIDQFIGTAKNIPPNREAEIFADLGRTFIISGQQFIWWRYTGADYDFNQFVTIRITGPSGTAWQLKRLCVENTTTTTTTSTSSTTTTTTTATPTTTTTTTMTGLDESLISVDTSIGPDCDLTLITTVWIDSQNPGSFTVGDVVYTDSGGTTVFVGNGDYYHIDLDGVGTECSCRINVLGELLTPITLC